MQAINIYDVQVKEKLQILLALVTVDEIKIDRFNIVKTGSTESVSKLHGMFNTSAYCIKFFDDRVEILPNAEIKVVFGNTANFVDRDASGAHCPHPTDAYYIYQSIYHSKRGINTEIRQQVIRLLDKLIYNVNQWHWQMNQANSAKVA